MPLRAFGTKFRIYGRFRTLNPQQLRTRYVRRVKFVGRDWADYMAARVIERGNPRQDEENSARVK